MALPQAAAGSRGDSKSEEEKALAVSYITRRVPVAAAGPEASRVGRWTVWWRTIWRRTAPGW